MLRPHSPPGKAGTGRGATPRTLNAGDAQLWKLWIEEEEEVPGPNYDEWVGVQPNPYDGLDNFNNCPDVGEEEDDPEDEDDNPTEWTETKMCASHFSVGFNYTSKFMEDNHFGEVMSDTMRSLRENKTISGCVEEVSTLNENEILNTLFPASVLVILLAMMNRAMTTTLKKKQITLQSSNHTSDVSLMLSPVPMHFH